MNILVLSNTPWANDNSFGNSFSNIFDGIPDLRFANIYCRYGWTENKFDMRYFQITEKTLLKNIKDKKSPSGTQVFYKKENDEELNEIALQGYDQARKMRWQVMFWARDFIWKIGRWKSIQLKMFLDDFKPDVIFQPVYYSSYINDIALFVKEYTGVPMVGYISDDNYTLRQLSFSPLFWVDRLWKRSKVKLVIEKSEILYVISQIQKEEYEKIFTPSCKILTKCADFSQQVPKWPIPGKTIKMLYAGNLGSGRWKSLALITDAVARLCQEGHEISLDIYSATPYTEKMKRSLSINGSVLHGAVSISEVRRLQKDADIVIHVEGLTIKSRMAVHQSFSTKLVDYFALGKCIFAIGSEDEASIRHLKDNDAAVVSETKDEVYQKLLSLIQEPKTILKYGEKAYSCGARHHAKRKMQTMVVNDLNACLEKYKVGNKKKMENALYESTTGKCGK